MVLKSVRSKEIPLITRTLDFLTSRAKISRIDYQELRRLVQERRYYGEINCTFYTEGAPANTYATLSPNSGQAVLEEALNIAESENAWKFLGPIREQVFKVIVRERKSGKWLNIRPNGTARDPTRNYICTIDLFEVEQV